MKTRANSFLKAFLLALLIPTVMISCGKDNKSGGGSSGGNTNIPAPPVPVDPWTGNSFGVGNGDRLPANWRDTLLSQIPCDDVYRTGVSTRTVMDIQLNGQVRVNVGALHIGVSSQGDVLIVSNDNVSTKATLYACERPAYSGQAQFAFAPQLNASEYCTTGVVQAADLLIGNNGAQFNTQPYYVKFFQLGFKYDTDICPLIY